MAEAAGEAEAVEEEEGAQDGNFAPPSCDPFLGNFGFFLYSSCLRCPFLINRDVERWSGVSVRPGERGVLVIAVTTGPPQRL